MGSGAIALDGTQEGRERILDVRCVGDYERSHRIGAVNIPLEELANRIHELPSRHVPVTIYDEDPRRSRWAASRLRVRGRCVGQVYHGRGWLSDGPTVEGPSGGRLWGPHTLLIEAVGHMRQAWPTFEGRRALDLACGSGRDAVFSALTGFSVEACDLLPDATALCGDLAARNGVSVVSYVMDLEGNADFGRERYDLISCFNFLHRPLAPRIAEAVRPGGFVVYETFVDPQRERFGRPRRDAHILKPGELLGWFEGWRIMVSRDGATGPGRIAASIVARKPDSAM